MATATKTTVDSDTTGATATVVVDYSGVLPPPIVYEYRRKKGRGKRRYSKDCKDPQILERGFSRSLERVADAVGDGLGRYRRRRDRSSRRKKDGAVKDFVKNVGRGLEKALRTGSKAPTDLTKRVTSKRFKRASRWLPIPVPVPPFFFVRR